MQEHTRGHVKKQHVIHSKRNHHSLVGPAVLGIVLIVAIATFFLLRGGSSGKATQQEISTLKAQCGDVNKLGDTATALLEKTGNVLEEQAPALDKRWTEQLYYSFHVATGTADSLENLAPTEEFEALLRGIESTSTARKILQDNLAFVSSSADTQLNMQKMISLTNQMETSLNCMHERLTVMRQNK